MLFLELQDFDNIDQVVAGYKALTEGLGGANVVINTMVRMYKKQIERGNRSKKDILKTLAREVDRFELPADQAEDVVKEIRKKLED